MKVFRYNVLNTTLISICLFCILFTGSGQNMPHGYINVNGTKIYIEGGGKGDPLIFVHAGFQDHRMWKYQVQDFIKNYQVIFVDLPGHGQTIDTSTRPLAETIIRTVMDSLHIRDASLVGCSLGGAVITDFAIAYPNRVRNLILVSSGLTGWEEGRQLQSETSAYVTLFDSALAKKDTASAAEVFTHYWFDGPNRKPKDFDTLLRKSVLNTTYYNLKQHRFSGRTRFASPSAIHRLSLIRAPVLVLTGADDLPEILLMNAYLTKNIPGAKQVIVTGAAHLINMERPQQFNSELMRFLKR